MRPRAMGTAWRRRQPTSLSPQEPSRFHRAPRLVMHMPQLGFQRAIGSFVIRRKSREIGMVFYHCPSIDPRCVWFRTGKQHFIYIFYQQVVFF